VVPIRNSVIFESFTILTRRSTPGYTRILVGFVLHDL
jgi:hypothetical protein